ncbi:MAG TPA: arsenate reductase (glutaredoxin) [Phycisphaerales bacterium]|nr:arsenate reductase (glutaredoxin) [Phycisphaerales bacterium]HCD31522.1 arsenate reductase (glutaredoxin) [Phycisphaerales bacterium]|tara:strand:+ start:2200 stop:2544 length:345 start_codon:yes stop_codon:yes gene_type:complete
MTTIYHNPQCSKSRQTLQLLKEHGTEPTVVEYLKTPPDEQTLREILQLLNMRPIDLVRQKEALFTELNLAAQKDDDQVILKAMLKHPRLIERPIVIHGNKAAIGRPPQNVVDLL